MENSRASHTTDSILIRRECFAIFRSAELTARQASVVAQRLDGLTFDEIGAARGHTKQGAHRIFCQALKKIGHARTVYPYTGLSEVYRGEIGRVS
ncbi:hypothetical protein OP10G_0252 [Fimbriimonas ginsengisoli Gsoil 348]|uniref:Uncharacterized protein n=2 Tax=Fimbriimonas ginsengisoli TaxID=1005039 RepID=A0A068NLK0_FIMGI|nr:hypothetical protein OP10G_0252 [Fimbriimonas ginsengisoli Gsoil 348]